MDRVFSARIDEGVLNEMNEVTRRLGLTKKRFLEEAIHERAKHLAQAAGTDVWADTLGAWRRKQSAAATVRAARRAFRKTFERHHKR